MFANKTCTNSNTKMFAKKICYKAKRTKNITKWIKNVREWKLCSKWHHHCLMSFLSHFKSMCGFLRLSMVLYGLFMVLYGLQWPLYCVFLPFVAKYRLGWTCIVYSLGHISKFIWSCHKQNSLGGCIGLEKMRISIWLDTWNYGIH